MTSKLMNNYDLFSSQNKALIFDAEITSDLSSFLDPASTFSTELLDLTQSTTLFPVSTNTTISSFSNAFTAQSHEDELLSSPLGLSPYDFNNSFDYNSPMLSTYSNSGTIAGLATPELTSDLALPNLFYPEIGSNNTSTIGTSSVWDPSDLNLSNLQALLEQATSTSNTVLSGSISPQMTSFDSPRLVEDLILPEFEFSPAFSTSSPIALSTATPATSVAAAAKKTTRKRKEITIESEEEEIEPVEERVTFAKDKFNGTRNTKIKPIDFNAPTMSRSYVIPSITSRKRAPPAISAKLIPTLASNKKARRSSTPMSFDEFNDEGVDPSELPDELLSAIELKRRQNTLAARRSRMRKAAHLDDVKKAEDEARRLVEDTKRELDEWKRRALTAEAELASLRGC